MAACPKGLESPLAKELLELGAEQIQESVAAVFFEASVRKLYEVISWSRIANRFVLVLLRQEFDSVDAYADAVGELEWPDYFDIDQPVSFAFKGSNREFRNPSFGAQRTKDAVQEAFNRRAREIGQGGQIHLLKRLQLNNESPEVLVSVRAFKRRYVVGLDLVGGSLHQRGYRAVSGVAPVKENLAAAILRLAGWQSPASEVDLDQPPPSIFIDPFCGTGTFLVEAMLIALGIAPSYLRDEQDWLVRNLLWHDEATWCSVRHPIDAQRQQLTGLQSGHQSWAEDVRPNCYALGFDIDPRSLHAARSNIEAAKLSCFIELKQCDISDLKLNFSAADADKFKMLVCNPPYAKRVGEVEKLQSLFADLGNLLRESCEGIDAAILNGNPELGWQTRLRSYRQHRVFNGSIECQVQRYRVLPEFYLSEKRKSSTSDSKYESSASKLSDNESMLVNRFKKRTAKLSKLIGQLDGAPFRFYDRDLPEYAFIGECFPVLKAGQSGSETSTRIHLQEYRAPASIPEHKVDYRRKEFTTACAAFFGVSRSAITFKMRERQKGRAQYQPSGNVVELQRSRERWRCRELGYQYLVDFESYLDTGVFIDSRGVRRWVAKEAKGKNFLNLFAYTATASLAAIAAGAKSSLSLDMSQTYIDWAKDNYLANKVDLRAHQLKRVDCMQWLTTDGPKFDLILLDPPSFSNSKRMEASMDLQRDHAELIAVTMQRLSVDGKLLFCTNKRGFKLDEELLEQYVAKPMDGVTIDLDCQGSKHVHHSWLLQHHPES